MTNKIDVMHLFAFIGKVSVSYQFLFQTYLELATGKPTEAILSL